MDGPKQSASFSEIADRYDQSRSLPNTFLEEAYRRLVREGILPPNARVVDIGTGTGQLSFPLVMLGFAVTGIDISHAMLRVAGAKRRPGMKRGIGSATGRAENKQKTRHKPHKRSL